MEEGFIERVFLSVIQIFGGGKRCRRGGSFIVSPYFCSVGEDFIERGPFYYCCHIFARKGRKFEGRNFVERWIMDIRLFLLFFFFIASQQLFIRYVIFSIIGGYLYAFNLIRQIYFIRLYPFDRVFAIKYSI